MVRDRLEGEGLFLKETHEEDEVERWMSLMGFEGMGRKGQGGLEEKRMGEEGTMGKGLKRGVAEDIVWRERIRGERDERFRREGGSWERGWIYMFLV